MSIVSPAAPSAQPPSPYYQDDLVTLYHGDCREVLASLDPMEADCAVTDPPYAETSHAWDRWPDRWLDAVERHAASVWCFGSMRMFIDRLHDFDGWTLAQDVVWDKNDGSCIGGDRFLRVHELATHWYRGQWRDVHHDQQREAHYGPRKETKRKAIGASTYGSLGAAAYVDDGQRAVRTIFRVSRPSPLLHPTEKPGGVLEQLIRYSSPAGGLVLEPFAGSGSTMAAAKAIGRRAVGVEADERFCEIAAKRLAQDTLFGGAA